MAPHSCAPRTELHCSFPLNCLPLSPTYLTTCHLLSCSPFCSNLPKIYFLSRLSRCNIISRLSIKLTSSSSGSFPAKPRRLTPAFPLRLLGVRCHCPSTTVTLSWWFGTFSHRRESAGRSRQCSGRGQAHIDFSNVKPNENTSSLD